MIHRNDLLYPAALENLSEYEKSLVDGAQNAGNSPRHMNLDKTGAASSAGTLQQIINPAAIRAAECGAPGCDSDISDGIGSLAEAIEISLSEAQNH